MKNQQRKLRLNKQEIAILQKNNMESIKGGVDFKTIWSLNCTSGCYSRGCSDGCGWTFVTWANCTKGGCSDDCKTDNTVCYSRVVTYCTECKKKNVPVA